MYNNKDGESNRYEQKRRDRNDRDDPNEKYKSRRNRWDEKEPESGTGNSRSRWDVKESESRSSRNRWDESERQPVSGNSRNRWNDKTGESSKTSLETGARAPEEQESSTNLSRSRDRKRSRSRSRSPFRRDFRNYANPTKDGYCYQSELSNHSSSSQTGTQDEKTSMKKQTSWSDSSDDDNDRSGKSNSNRNSTRSPGQPSQRHYEDYKNNEVPSLDIQASKQLTADKLGGLSSSGISLKLGGSAVKPTPLPKVISVPVPVKSTKVAAVFGDSDDDEPEEMPPECKMRMKNVGRETRTSEGPNSFGKTKIGFCNMSHLAEKHLEDKGGAKKKA